MQLSLGNIHCFALHTTSSILCLGSVQLDVCREVCHMEVGQSLGKEAKGIFLLCFYPLILSVVSRGCKVESFSWKHKQ